MSAGQKQTPDFYFWTNTGLNISAITIFAGVLTALIFRQKNRKKGGAVYKRVQAKSV